MFIVMMNPWNHWETSNEKFFFSIGKTKTAIFQGNVPRLIKLCSGLFSQTFNLISVTTEGEELDLPNFRFSFGVKVPCCVLWVAHQA